MYIKKEDSIYKSYDCIKFSNGTIDLIIPRNFGPRIIYAGFKEEKNFFEEVEDVEFKTKYGTWKLYGGHRLWIAPENIDTYYPDNEPVDITYDKEDKTLIVSKIFYKIGFKKEISLKFINKNKVKTVHKIYNISSKNKILSLWTLSVMAKNGTAILPQNVETLDNNKFLPNRNLVLWQYTDFKDKRLKITNDFIYIKQDPKAKTAFKIGQYLNLGWIGYKFDNYLFVKKFKINKYYSEYPDFASNVEVYSCNKFLELELLSPLVKLKSKQVMIQEEVWEFYKK